VHGIVHAEFQEYVVERLGPGRWARSVERAGLTGKTYSPNASYPDEELLALVLAVSQDIDEPLDAVLTSFGRTIVPGLLATYAAFIDRRWGAAEVLEHVERVVHRTIRLQDPQATPPYLTAERRSDDEVVIRYTSPRRLCAFGKGLIHGVADHYGRRATIHDEACMHRGDEACVLRVALEPRG
jgi:predicted hydrocarbon binding protein